MISLAYGAKSYKMKSAQSGDDVFIRLSPPHGACAAVIRRRGHEELVEVPW